MSSKKSTVTTSFTGSSANNIPYSKTNLEKKKRRPGTTGELGVLYEKKLLMLVLHRALKNEYDFTLDTNIEGVGAFDDVVLTYKEKDGKEKRIYLQAKHKESKTVKIRYDDLLKSGNSDFALYKYFNDYKEIIRNFDKKGKLESKYFIIYSNIGLHGDGEEIRVEKAETKEGFVFRKLDVSRHTPLGIFSTVDSFYQISGWDKNNESNETVGVIDVLKDKFKAFGNENQNELESELEGFLNTLIFAVGQHNETDLGNLIKEEIKEVHSDSLSQDHVDFMFEYAMNRIGQWKNSRKSKPLTEENNYFTQGRDKFKEFSALYPTLVNENKLCSSIFLFKQEKYENLYKFINSKNQLWIISSKTPCLNNLIIYQALNDETLKVETGINYANYDHHLFLTFSDLINGHELILPVLNNMRQFLLIITIDSTNTLKSGTPHIVEKIASIVSASEGKNLKQLIVIAPRDCEFSQQLKQKLASSYNEEYKIEFDHLTPESQKTCLMEKKILIQGNDELYSIQQLMGLKQTPEASVTNFSLDKLELETFLKNTTIEIRNEEPKFSHYELAHYKTYSPIEMERLKNALIMNSTDIFAFVGEEDQVRLLLPQQVLNRFQDVLTPANGDFILLNADNEEEQFKQLCHQVDVQGNVTQPTLHLLKKGKDQWVWIRTYSKDFYMDRLFYPVLVDKKLLKKELVQASSSLDFIVFSGTNEEDLFDLLAIYKIDEKRKFRRNSAVFLEEAMAQQRFDSCDFNLEDKSVHWLKIIEKEDQKEIQWFCSMGKVNPLNSLLLDAKEVKTYLTETCLVESKERVVLLADEPGMGKTTTLTRMAEMMKKQEPLSWVMKIDLNLHQAALASKKMKTLDDFVDLLTSIDEKIDEPLTRRILTYQLACPKNVVLLWDGFDEVKSERQDAILKLFEFLKKETGAALWITTRRHDQRKLEERLSVLSHAFVPINKAQQINFLSRFWAMTLKLNGENPNIHVLRSHAEEIIQALDRTIQNYEADTFISIPLRARLLAEVAEKTLINRKPISEILNANKQLSIGNLFEQFVTRKYDIYFREKAIIGERLDDVSREILIKSYSDAYELLALLNLFDPLSKKNESFEYPVTSLEIKGLLNSLLRIGLVQGNKDPVNFIHRTFAEYFAGKWFAENINSLDVKKFLCIQIFKKEFTVMRRFFDYFITQKLDLHKAVLEGDLLALQKTLREDSEIDIADGIGRTPLHLAAQEGRSELVQYLQTVEDDKLIRDHSGKTALHYAAGFGHVTVINELLENYIDINIDGYNFKTKLHFFAQVWNGVLRKPKNRGSKLLKLVNEKDESGKTALCYAVVNECWIAANSLLFYGAYDFPIDGIEFGTEYSIEKNISTIKDKLYRDLHLEAFNANTTCILDSMVVFLLNFKFLDNIHRKQHIEIEFFGRYLFTLDLPTVFDAFLRKIKKRKRTTTMSRALSSSSTINYTGSDVEHCFNDPDYLRILKYFRQQCKKLAICTTFKEHYAFLSTAVNSGCFETSKYLFEYGIRNKDNFPLKRSLWGIGKRNFSFFQRKIIPFGRRIKLQDNKKYIMIFFSDIKNLNSENPWLRNLISSSCGHFGWTRLHLVAMNQYVNSIEDFLEPPVYENVNMKDLDGCTPLACAACFNGRSEFIESFFVALKTRNLNDRKKLYEIINAKNIECYTPLHWAIKKGNLDSAIVLLKNIKDIGFEQEELFNIVNSRDNLNSNAIRYVQVLKDFSRYSEGKTLKEPKSGELKEFFGHLFEYMKTFHFSSQQCSEILIGSRDLLHNLIYNEKMEEALTLIKEIENLPLEDRKRTEFLSAHCEEDCGNTPLHAIARPTGIGVLYHSDYIYRLTVSLLRNGAVFNACNCVGDTPLNYISSPDNHETWCEVSEASNKTYFLLRCIESLFELVADEQIIENDEKKSELMYRLYKLKQETWIDPNCILNARNRERKTLQELCKFEEIIQFLKELKR